MDKRTDQLVNAFISKVASQNPNLVTTYLFGSYAKQNERNESDIDIAIVLDNLLDEQKFDVQVQLMVLASQFDSRIEPHPFSTSDFNSQNPFVYEIMRTGIEMKPKNGNLN